MSLGTMDFPWRPFHINGSTPLCKLTVNGLFDFFSSWLCGSFRMHSVDYIRPGRWLLHALIATLFRLSTLVCLYSLLPYCPRFFHLLILCSLRWKVEIYLVGVDVSLNMLSLLLSC